MRNQEPGSWAYNATFSKLVVNMYYLSWRGRGREKGRKGEKRGRKGEGDIKDTDVEKLVQGFVLLRSLAPVDLASVISPDTLVPAASSCC